MTLLLGSETEGTVEVAIANEHVGDYVFTALHTGTVESIRFKAAKKGTNTSTVFGIFSVNELSTPRVPVTLLGSATHTGNIAENEVVEVTGLSISVTEGKEYALVVLTLGGALKLKHGLTGTAGENAKPTKVTSLGEVTEWSNTIGVGTAFFAALGTEAGSVKVQPVGGSLSFAGTLSRATTRQLPAGLTFLGAIGRRSTRSLPASLSFAGTAQRNTSRSLPAGLSFTGSLPRNNVHGLTASLSFAGQLQRTTRHQLVAALTFLGNLTPQEVGKFVHRIEAALSFEGRLGKATARQLPAGLSFQGTLQRSSARRLPAVLSFTGILPRNTRHPVSASLSFAGALGRAVRMPLRASLGFVGRLGFKGAKARGLPGRVRPFQRLGQGTPSPARFTGALEPRATLFPRANLFPTRGRIALGAGRSKPRTAHRVPALTPNALLYPSSSLYPKGGVSIEPD